MHTYVAFVVLSALVTGSSSFKVVHEYTWDNPACVGPPVESIFLNNVCLQLRNGSSVTYQKHLCLGTGVISVFDCTANCSICHKLISVEDEICLQIGMERGMTTVCGEKQVPTVVKATLFEDDCNSSKRPFSPLIPEGGCLSIDSMYFMVTCNLGNQTVTISTCLDSKCTLCTTVTVPNGQCATYSVGGSVGIFECLTDNGSDDLVIYS